MRLFDVLGPVMIGPSSSHTAGAARIGYTAQKLLGDVPVEADIGLYGSFATTGRGHGTDRALVAGLLGLRPDDPRLPDSFALAEEAGMKFTIHPVELRAAHPNTAVLTLKSKAGRTLVLKAASVGGGRIRVTEIDGVPADFGGDSNTLIIHNEDTPGCIAEVTMSLAQRRINKHRNYQDSCARVAKRLKQLGGPGAECYLDVTVHSKRDVQPCGFLHVSGNCVYAVKVFWWGLKVTGSAEDTTWTFSASKEFRRQPNPLPELEETCVALNRLFVRRGLTGVPVKPLVVLADNFGSSHSHVSGTDCIVAYQDLKKWRKAYPLDKKKDFDIAAVKAALEASFADGDSPEKPKN